jgi:DNA-binding SARP family transcriptional activator
MQAEDAEAAYAAVEAAWKEAGDAVEPMVRAHWPELEPVLWRGLAEGALDPDRYLPALEGAFPNGEALVAFAEHPSASVRRAALPAALAANHPIVLDQLVQLTEDDDEEVAAAAVRTRDRLAESPPPLRFSVLGRFGVRRGGWDIADESWGRPIDARLVRFLLVRGGDPVAEDLIFEALWPELSAASARRSLQVAVSRVRRVIDVPAIGRSAIDSGDRSYRLVLGEADSVDAEEFRAAAEAAMARPERVLLERARSLWGGEPLTDERYSDWAASYRERLTDAYVGVLTGLIDIHRNAGEHLHAADAARELVDLDPLNEGGHRALM